MHKPRSSRRWLRLPGRVALILGLGALSTAGVRADTPKQGNLTTGDTLIRSEGGRIFLSEGGRETELGLSATPERDRLLRLIEEHGAGGVKLDRDRRLIMSSGGGAGFSLWDLTKHFTGNPASGLKNTPPVSTRPNSPKPATDPRNQNFTVDRKG